MTSKLNTAASVSGNVLVEGLHPRDELTNHQIPRNRLKAVTCSDSEPPAVVPELIRKLSNDPRVSKDRRNWPKFDEIAGKWPLEKWVNGCGFFNADGEDQQRMRQLAKPWLTARRIASLLPDIERIVEHLLDDLAAMPPGEIVDLYTYYAELVPVNVVSAVLFGIPKHLQSRFRRVVIGTFDTTLTAEEAEVVRREYSEVLHTLVAFKRSRPADDLTAALVSVHDRDPERLSEEELIDNLLNLTTGGMETGTNLIEHAVVALLADPAQLAYVHEGRASWDDVVEEALRLAAPSPHVPMRYATEDIHINEELVIRKGEAIMPSYGAANHHPEYFGPDTEKFDVLRPSRKEHLSFGHGAHFCIGAPLARPQARIALSTLFDRFPDMHLAVPADDLQPKATAVSGGYSSLPVYLHAAGAR